MSAEWCFHVELPRMNRELSLIKFLVINGQFMIIRVKIFLLELPLIIHELSLIIFWGICDEFLAISVWTPMSNSNYNNVQQVERLVDNYTIPRIFAARFYTIPRILTRNIIFDKGTQEHK